MHRDGGKTSAQETLQRPTTSGILSLPCSSTARGRMGAVGEGTYQITGAQLHLKHNVLCAYLDPPRVSSM
ncbi:Phosphatidylethanolamine-binding protein [Musa troglodytarum]|nr:Phosphatidylethanolamine-binding protein [Musa troglodytarum]